MTNTRRLLGLLIPLREQTAQLHLHDDHEAEAVADELRNLVSELSPTATNPAIRSALSDAEAAEGRILEYLDTPEGPEARIHLESAVASLDDAIFTLSKAEGPHSPGNQPTP